MSLTTKDIETLSAPFAKDNVGVKVQSQSKDRTKAMLVLYLQHTDVYGRIESVDPAWSCLVLNEDWRGDTIFVRMRITIKGVSRENVGEGNDPKSACSDALKRCAMLFGVGRYLYDTETVWVPYNEQNDRFRVWTFDEFQKALRPGQATPPTGAAPASGKLTAAPKIAAPVGPKANTPAPVVSRQSVGTEILKAARQLGMTDEQMDAWIQDDFKKPRIQMTIPELQKFLGMLQLEIGRAGVPA